MKPNIEKSKGETEDEKKNGGNQTNTLDALKHKTVKLNELIQKSYPLSQEKVLEDVMRDFKASRPVLRKNVHKKIPILGKNYTNKLLCSLRERIANCESMLGQKIDSDCFTANEEINENMSPEEQHVYREWRTKIQSNIEREETVFGKLIVIDKLIDAIIQRRGKEFEKKYELVKLWLESQHCEVTQLILSLEAKKSFILSQESNIYEMAEQLAIIDDLKEYINSPYLPKMSQYRARLSKIESKGEGLRRRAEILFNECRSLSCDYATIVHSAIRSIEEWKNITTVDETAIL